MTEESTFERTNREASAPKSQRGSFPSSPGERDYPRLSSVEYDDVVEKRRNVVCGFKRSEKVIECRGTIGRLATTSSGRRLGLPLGYDFASDGVWRFSEYADRRARRGKDPRPHHFPGFIKVRRPPADTDGWRSSVTLKSAARAPYPSLPAWVECRECHQLRYLDGARLEVADSRD